MPDTDNPLAPSPQETSFKNEGFSVIHRVLPYLWSKDSLEMRLRIILSLIALVLARAIAVAAPLYLGAAVDALQPENGDQTVFLLTAGAVGLTLAYGFARLMTVGFNQLRDVIFAKVGQRAFRKIALQTFRHIHSLSMNYHITRKTGGLSRVIERGVKGVEFLLRFLLFSIGPLILELCLIATLLGWKFEALYLLIVIVTIILYTWFTFTVTEWRVRLRKQMNDRDTEANQKAIDSLLNFETVKYFDAEEREAARYDESIAGYEAAALKTSYSLGFLNFGQSFIITTGLVIVMVMAAFAVGRGDMSVGNFVTVNALMIQVTMPLNFLGTVYREIRQALVDMGEMFTLLEHPSDIKDKDNAPSLTVTEGHITFENVFFGYSKKRPILKNFNLDIARGKTIAIVGSSGSGKSTIGRLLFRFYDIDSGSIKIDGQDIRDVTQSSLHRSIGIVPQDTVLFNDTIGYNIAYGKTGATLSEIIAVAKAAKIHEFIKSLPEGYDTMVGERGLKLSGGEKQRVGIARTLLKNPSILVLDEATSALDTDTEKNIQKALHEMGQGRSVIVIAHRLSTIVESDQIIVLEKGHIVETGTHNALLNRNGRYAHLWQTQAYELERA